MTPYRWLLGAYPRAFRRRYGAEMEATFALMRADARARSGRLGVARAWIRAVADISAHAAAEHRAGRRRSGGSTMLESLAIDIRQASRSLLARPSLTIPAILTIALGIGANAGIFGIVNAMLFRPLPYAEPDRLVLLWERFQPMNLDTMPWSIPDYLTMRERATQLSGTAIFRGDRAVLLDGEPTRLAVISAEANLFDLLGVAPMLGRGYDRSAGKREVVLAYTAWRDRFGADPNVVGRTISLDSGPMAIVGVMPEGFQFPPPITFGDQMLTRDPDMYTAFDLERSVAQGQHSHFAVGRMAPSASIGSTLSELSAIAADISAANPDSGLSVPDFGIHAVALHGQSVTTVRRSLLVILGAVAAVLLIACASVANLLLARAMARRHEMAMRASLGASRGRLIRQLLVESLLLGAVGGAAGMLLAPWIAAGLLAASPIDLQQMTDVRVDGTVLMFALLTTLGAVLFFGLIPALQGSRLDLISVMRSGSRVSATRSELRTKSLLVVGQVSIAMVLLVAAGLSAQSLSRLWAVDPGFTPGTVQAFRIDLPPSRYPDGAAWLGFQQRLVERLDAVPGIDHVSVVTTLPFTFDRNAGNYVVEGEPPRPAGEFMIASRNTVSPAYFQTLGIRLIAGRTFRDSDTSAAPRVVIVSRAVADRHWPGQDPIGRRVAYDPPDEQDPDWMTVVGVADDVLMLGFDAAAEPMFDLPATQAPVESFWVTYQATRPESGRDIRAAAATLDGALPVGTIEVLTSLMGDTVKKPRFTAVLLSAFGLTALFIAAVGLYGVMAFDVARQTRDIGVRLALGATPGSVRRGVLSRGLTLALTGLALGMAAAFLTARSLMASLLFGVSAADVSTFAATGLVLVLVAGIASWLPARRATRVDPMVALRSE
jgi:putative ABC transport system permease protein